MRLIDCFVQIVNMSISASVVALILALLRFICRKQMTAGFKYLMWALLFLRLMIPISIPTTFSLFNLFSQGTSQTNGTYMVSIEYIEDLSGYIALEGSHYKEYLLFTFLWLAGFLLFFVYQMILFFITKRRLRMAFHVKDSTQLEHCKQNVGVTQNIQLLRSDAFETPVVMGIFRPKIILPLFLDMSCEQQMEHIFLHELIHIRRHDHIVKLLAVFALSLHWFNPLIWFCYREYLKDIETSCDEQVLALLNESQRTAYATTLVELCSTQKKRFDMALMAFAENRSLLSTRVIAALEYKPSTFLKKVALATLMIVTALVTQTNPVAAYTGYIPHGIKLDDATLIQYEQLTKELSYALSSADEKTLLTLTHYNEPFYMDVYSHLDTIPVTHYKLYPQNEELVYAYLRCKNGWEYVAELTNLYGEVKVSRLRTEQNFSSLMSVEECEAVRFVRNLHRFGIVSSEKKLSEWAVAGLCISEEYHDRVKSGEISADTTELPSEWVEHAAKTYFGLDDFSYTEDEEMYDELSGCYLVDHEREDPANAEVIACELDGDNATVTAKLYRDPLRLLPKATISYQLKKK